MHEDDDNIKIEEPVEIDTPQVDLDVEGTKDDDAQPETSVDQETTPEPKMISVDKFKELAKEYGLDNEEFAALDDPDEIARRTMQQMKGFRNLYHKMRNSWTGTPPPQPGYSPPAPADTDKLLNDFMTDPNSVIDRRIDQILAERQQQMFQVRAQQEQIAINEWEAQQKPQEIALCAPYIMADPNLQMKRAQGQIITVDDVKASFQRAKAMHYAYAKSIRDQGVADGETIADKKRRAVVEGSHKPSGKGAALNLDQLVEKYGMGNIPQKELDAALKAEGY